jgi:hypothetical protein
MELEMVRGVDPLWVHAGRERDNQPGKERRKKEPSVDRTLQEHSLHV